MHIQRGFSAQLEEDAVKVAGGGRAAVIPADLRSCDMHDLLVGCVGGCWEMIGRDSKCQGTD